MNRNTLFALAASFAPACLPVQAQDDGMPSRAPELGTSTQAQDDGPSQDSFTAGALKADCAPAVGLDKNARALADLTCQSYLRGLTEGLFLQAVLQSTDAAECLPKDGPVSIADAEADLLGYLADNPDAATHEAATAVVFALVKAHGCGAD